MRGTWETTGGRGSPVAFLLIVGAVAAAVFWPTVVAVAAAVALLVKLTLIAMAAVTALGGAVAVGVAVRRHRRREPSASVLAVQPVRPTRRGAHELAVAEQLAALTAAVDRLADQRRPALPAPAPGQPVVVDQQALALLLTQLARIAVNADQGPRELAGRWDGR